jgi:hypothetical protein
VPDFSSCNTLQEDVARVVFLLQTDEASRHMVLQSMSKSPIRSPQSTVHHAPHEVLAARRSSALPDPTAEGEPAANIGHAIIG